MRASLPKTAAKCSGVCPSVSHPGVGASGKQLFGDGQVPPPMRRLEQGRHCPLRFRNSAFASLARERVEDPDPCQF